MTNRIENFPVLPLKCTRRLTYKSACMDAPVERISPSAGTKSTPGSGQGIGRLWLIWPAWSQSPVLFQHRGSRKSRGGSPRKGRSYDARALAQGK
jgi:hypothetical protein